MTPLLSESDELFLSLNTIGTISTIRPNGTPHVVPVRFTWDPKDGLARVMTVGNRRKARNVAANGGGRAAICQVAGFRWVTLEGAAGVTADPVRVGDGIEAYIQRYHAPPPIQPGLVVIEIAVERVLGGT